MGLHPNLVIDDIAIDDDDIHIDGARRVLVIHPLASQICLDIPEHQTFKCFRLQARLDLDGYIEEIGTRRADSWGLPNG